MKKILFIIPVVAVVILMAKRGGFLEPTNVCQTQPDHIETALRTRFYQASKDTVCERAVALCKEQRTYMRVWNVVAEQPKIRVEVPVVFFTDDLTITILEEGTVTRVDVHSASRVGRGDFGENRRHVLQFLNTLDAQFLSFSSSGKKFAEL